MSDAPVTRPAPSSHQVRLATYAITSAVETLAIHGKACGHRRHDDECGYCDDRRVAHEARGAARVLFDALAAERARADQAAEKAWDEGAEFAVDYRIAPLYENPYRTAPTAEQGVDQ